MKKFSVVIAVMVTAFLVGFAFSPAREIKGSDSYAPIYYNVSSPEYTGNGLS